LTVSDADVSPADVGLNVRLTVQLACDARAPAHVVALTLKGVLVSPLKVRDVMAALPMFVRVTVCAAEVMFTV
jgi:hypothetical protein